MLEYGAWSWASWAEFCAANRSQGALTAVMTPRRSSTATSASTESKMARRKASLSIKAASRCSRACNTRLKPRIKPPSSGLPDVGRACSGADASAIRASCPMVLNRGNHCRRRYHHASTPASRLNRNVACNRLVRISRTASKASSVGSCATRYQSARPMLLVDESSSTPAALTKTPLPSRPSPYWPGEVWAQPPARAGRALSPEESTARGLRLTSAKVPVLP